MARQLQRMRNGDGLVFSEPTNASRRTIDLPGRTIEALRSHRKCQLEEKKKLRAASYWDSGLVSATGKGTPLDTQNVVNRHFKPLLRRAGLPDIRFHDLRHTCATLLARKNVNPKIVQDTLGHASLSMTLGIYSHVQAAMKDEAAALTVRADAGAFRRFQKGEACSW